MSFFIECIIVVALIIIGLGVILAPILIKKEQERLAQLKRTPLKAVDVPLKLQNGEECYYDGFARLVRLKRVRGAAYYHGPVVNIPIAKGIHYRAAIYSGGIAGKETFMTVDAGQVYVTSHRIIFRGEKHNNSVSLSKILEIHFYSDRSMRIDKENGTPFIMNACDSKGIEVIVKKILGVEESI